MYPGLIKENQRMSTCNRLDLQTQRISTDYAQKSPDHWSRQQDDKHVQHFDAKMLIF